MSAKARARRPLYAVALTPEERKMLSEPVTPEEQEDLLRICLLRLSRQLAPEPSTPAQLAIIRLIYQLAQALIGIQRRKNGKGAPAEDPIAEIGAMLASLEPYRDA